MPSSTCLLSLRAVTFTPRRNIYTKGSVKALRMHEIMRGAGICSETKRRMSLLGSQAVKLMSQGQIAVIGEDLQHFAPCKRIHEGPGFRIPASGFRIPAFWIPKSIHSGFRIAYHSGFRIPSHCGFKIPVLWIPDFNSKTLLDSLTWGEILPDFDFFDEVDKTKNSP